MQRPLKRQNVTYIWGCLPCLNTWYFVLAHFGANGPKRLSTRWIRTPREKYYIPDSGGLRIHGLLVRKLGQIDTTGVPFVLITSSALGCTLRLDIGCQSFSLRGLERDQSSVAYKLQEFLSFAGIFINSLYAIFPLLGTFLRNGNPKKIASEIIHVLIFIYIPCQVS